MSNGINRGNGKKVQTESFATTCYLFFRQVLDYLICIYMLLIIVVMPFYFEDGFTHIGTDKHIFFRNCSLNIGKLLIPVLAACGVCGIIRHIAEYQERKQFQNTHGKYWRSVLKTWIRTFTCTDIFALLYGISLIVSYCCSDYKDTALWGTQGWFMGLIPQLCLLAGYFCISRLWKARDWMFLLFLPVSAVVFGLAVLNRFGIYPIDMKLKDPNFISTIGNINWYCGYMVSVFFAGLYLLWQNRRITMDKEYDTKKRWTHILLVLYVGIGFATLVIQGSMSAFLALGVVLVVLFCMSAKDSNCMMKFWQIVLILAVSCLVLMGVRLSGMGEINYKDGLIDLCTNSLFPLGLLLLSIFCIVVLAVTEKKECYPKKFFCILAWIVGLGTVAGIIAVIGMIVVNTLRPGSLGVLSEYSFFTFSKEWGSFRGATWRIGAMCVQEQSWQQRLVGVGPDSMEAFIRNAGSQEMQTLLVQAFGGLRLTNAHCEWFTILINTGIFGMVSYAGMMVSAIICFLKQKKGTIDIIGACGLCVLAYTVNNMVSFQQSMSVATIYVILGIGRAYLGRLHIRENGDKIV